MLKMSRHLNESAVTHYCNEYRSLIENLVISPPALLQTLQKTALDYFSNSGFPTQKNPDWKYTPLTNFLNIPFSIHARNNAPKKIISNLPSLKNRTRLVFVNGYFHPSLSSIETTSHEIIISDLSTQLKKNPDQLINLWKSKIGQNNSFINLNTAFIERGAFIYLPTNTTLASPIELLFINHGKNAFIPIRNVIITDTNSRATIIEKYISLENSTDTYFSNTVTECFLSKQSQIEHYKLIEESKNSLHIGTLCATQYENSQFNSYSIALTAKLIRSDIRAELCQPHASCDLKGLYNAREEQHISHQTIVDHKSPYTYSQEFYKGIIDDNANASFNGKVIVQPEAIKSKAEQLNKNLLVSPTAEINTKPQLEIFVDDIQCTHGASIGQLDENALFYLQSRGINASEARTLLMHAFIQDIIQQMPLLKTYSELMPLLNSLSTIPFYETV